MRTPAAIVMLVVGVWCAAGLAQEAEFERAVKAACLYNFAKFVTWPASAFADPEAPLVIGVVGEDPFGAVLDSAVRGKHAHDRRIEVKRFGPLKPDAAPHQRLRECHILFVSLAERERAADVRSAVRGAPVLLVSDIPDFAVDGGVIELAMEQGQVRCKVNREAAKRGDLELSAKLLRLAQIVKERDKE